MIDRPSFQKFDKKSIFIRISCLLAICSVSRALHLLPEFSPKVVFLSNRDQQIVKILQYREYDIFYVMQLDPTVSFPEVCNS